MTKLHPRVGEHGNCHNTKRHMLYFLNQKHQKEAISRGLRRKEAMKEEGMGFYTLVLETRTNLCSFPKRFIKIGSK